MTVLAFPGGGVCLDSFRTDEAPTKTTRLCECGKAKDERGNCQFCEAVACNAEDHAAALRLANQRWATEEALRADLEETESILFRVLHRSKSGFWRTHVDAARERVTKAINELNESGFEDSPPCEVPR